LTCYSTYDIIISRDNYEINSEGGNILMIILHIHFSLQLQIDIIASGFA